MEPGKRGARPTQAKLPRPDLCWACSSKTAAKTAAQAAWVQAQKLGLFGIAANPAKACKTQRVQATALPVGESITGWYNVVCQASLDF